MAGLIGSQWFEPMTSRKICGPIDVVLNVDHSACLLHVPGSAKMAITGLQTVAYTGLPIIS